MFERLSGLTIARIGRGVVYRIKRLIAILCLYLFHFCSLFVKKKHWVISERGTDARDNGLHFYRYMKREHPEKKVYFIVQKGSRDYEQVKPDAIPYGSLRALRLSVMSEKFISAHCGASIPYIGVPRFSKFFGKKFYFLQHGIIKNDHPSLHADRVSMKLFVCGALPEYRFISSTFGFEEGVVRYTGLARYDALAEYETKRQILLMPTWREYLAFNEAEFLSSDYYREYSRLLTDEALIAYLKRENIRLIFYPHQELQKYLKHFKTKSENVVLASYEDYDVQQLLKESMLLVTDYSSVFFDFAYMGKPVLYFQFDRDEFEEKHYSGGYFDYDTMGFGKVSFTLEELKGDILQTAENQFTLSEEYRKRIDGFFVMRDRKNCERIYRVMTE